MQNEERIIQVLYFDALDLLFNNEKNTTSCFHCICLGRLSLTYFYFNFMMV